MTNTLLRSQKKIPDHIVEILRDVFGASAKLGIKAFVIGATARDLIFEYAYGADIRRKTEDVDFAISVRSWAEYQNLKSELIGGGRFRNDKNQELRLWWKGGSDRMRVDLVPYGGLESGEANIQFPPHGDFAMSTLGFRETSDNLLVLQLTEEFAAEVASLPGLVLLKFVAYHDRPAERRRDVQDIWFIAQNYMKAGNEDRLYGENSGDHDLLTEGDFDYRTVGARLLGRDLAPLLTDDTRKIVTRILAHETDGGVIPTFADVIHADGLRDSNRYDDILLTLAEFWRGVREGLSKKEN